MDSLDEVALSAYNALTGELKTSLAQLSDNYLELFKLNRFHVQPASDFASLARWCLSNAKKPAHKLLSTEEYKNLLLETNIPEEKRRKDFFQARKNFVTKHRQAWLDLHRPFQPLFEELKNRDSEQISLVTNKNKQAVLDLCEHFKLNLKPENIHSGDQGTSKTEHIRKIIEKNPSKKHRFIDDSLYNLRQIKSNLEQNSNPPTLLLASWGYIGPNDPTHAKKENIQVLSQTELLKLL